MIEEFVSLLLSILLPSSIYFPSLLSLPPLSLLSLPIMGIETIHCTQDFFKIGSGFFSDALIALHANTVRGEASKYLADLFTRGLTQGLSWAFTICIGTLILR